MSEHPPLADETITLLRRASTATLTTQLFNRGLHNQFLVGVRPLDPANASFVGEAVTLRSIPAREDIDQVSVFADPEHPQRKVIETVGPGQVLVFECRGDLTAANGGAILMTRAKMRGAVAMVSDGALRDSPEIAQLGWPVFAAGQNATMSLARHHAVAYDVPIGCAGVAVYPRDVLVGDAEGVVVIPRHLAAEIAGPAAEQELMETFVMERVRAGAPLPGTYPPNEETKAAYEEWKRERRV